MGKGHDDVREAVGNCQAEVEERADDDECFGGGTEEVLAGGETDLFSCFVGLCCFAAVICYVFSMFWFVNQSI